MKDHDLGMNLEQVLVVRGYGFQSFNVYDAFKNKLSGEAFVRNVGYSSATPGEEIIELSLKPKVSVDGSPNEKEVKLITVDDHYFQTIEAQMIAGHGFDRAIATDDENVIVNEAAARLLGYQDPKTILNEYLSGLAEKKLKVIGVIKNYNQRSLKNNYEPVVFLPAWANDFGWNRRFFVVRLNAANGPEQRQQQISHVEKVWKEVSPGKPFQYFFLDNQFDQQYKADTTFTSLFMFFSLLAIFIACLGLFGLVAYTTLQRTKEIGVRKVLGASIGNILVLLSADFIKLIVIACLLSVPPIILVAREWLDQYAFRIDLSMWLFVIPFIAVFSLALITVVMKSLGVATANPVDSLRYE
jgi:putative ABC transport system permease protein